ncbi:hypothetical protein BH10BAC2_BH10BAC2_02650 [soil metagenome]
MNQQTNAGYFKAISVLFTALLAGQIIFLGFSMVLVFTGSFKSSMPQAENIFFILVPVLIIAGRISGTTIYKKKLQQALGALTLAEKLNLYRSTFITRCALLEGPVMFAIITFLLTNRVELLLFAAGGLFLFYRLKPTLEKVANELQIASGDMG